MAVVRAVAVFAVGAASAKRFLVLDVLLAAVHAGVGVRASSASAAADDPRVAPASALVAKRSCAVPGIY